ncbi:WD40 repeat-like protein [Saccharata proteae CBS 121410]|uniref:WD40 repeat-like protein n=1 Tax=Saccharata proteae CBS 121410 TaxID=1314787 RepID=A0A9P4HZR2_9PEZI|nr:WD40 repeat-like protein [Saccharata proteae CBS 121410]
MDEMMIDADPRSEMAAEEVEQKLTNEEYKIWKKNSVWLYDLLYARALEWPTLTTQWLPDVREVPGTNLSEHRLLFGTNTSDQAQNYLQIARLEIPDLRAPPDPANLDENRGEIGSHGAAKKPFTFKVIQRINHPGEINKARYQPQNPNLIATMCTDGRALIFDRTKHTSEPAPQGTYKFDMELKGHTAEGFGLSWSPHHEGHLATGSEDTTVRLWDTKAGFSKSNNVIKPTATYTHHTSTVNDVQHHPIQPYLIGTVSDDLTVQIIDTRQESTKKARFKENAHTDAVNCLAFHPSWESILVTGSADKSIGIWDMRCMDKKIHSYEGHTQAVLNLEWHPTDHAILASSSYDKRIMMWDASRIGDEQTEEEAEDGPPELLFMHGGFTNSICDFSWNKTDPWVMLAAAEDNQLQVFRPARTIVQVPMKKVPNREVSE